jgi:four helix bundle protein
VPRKSEPGCETDRSSGLAERTVAFGQAAMRLAESTPEAPNTDTICEQLARAGAAVGDSYQEAAEAQSELDHKHRMSICRKEIRETVRWLRMLIEVLPDTAPAAQPILQEAKELTLALSAAAQSGARPAPEAQSTDEDIES